MPGLQFFLVCSNRVCKHAYFFLLSYTQCVSPYVGDGSLCVLDTDADGYPDQALSSCSDEDSAIYCSKDTCPYAPNPDQSNIDPCIGDIAGTGSE